MSEYIGDFNASASVGKKFCTHKADGTPITLGGTPAVSVYKKGSTTESTAGVTLTVDYDSHTGLHDVVIDTSADGTFYAAGNDFEAVITTGTVDSISVVGTTLFSFSIENRNIKADVTKWKGTTAATVDTAGYPVVTIKDGTGAGELNLTLGVVDANLVQSLGVTVTNSDFTIASATASTVTLPATYTSGSTLPDDDRYIGTVLQVVGGTGAGQIILLTTAGASTRQYNVLSGTMPVQLDNTSTCVVLGTWRSDLETIKTQAVTCSGAVTIPNGTLASTTNITTAAGCAVSSIATNAITAASLATDAGAEIADAVWDEVQSGHTTAGTFGKFLDAAVSGVSTGGVSAADIATAVWTDLLAGSDFSTSASIGKLIKDNLNATITSRMATYTQPTGFLAATFPSGTVASTTNITSASGVSLAANQHVIVDSGTVTTLTNLPTITTDWISAAGLSAAAATKIANAVEVEIIDETDSEKVLTAITDKIASVNPSLSGLTLSSIASAVRDVSNASPSAGSLGAGIKAGSDRMPVSGTLATTADVPTASANASATAAQITTDHGAGSYIRNTEPPTASAISTQVATDLATAHGSGSWLTATSVTVSDKTGFSLTSAYDFAKGTVAVTESYAVNKSAPTPVQALLSIHQMLMGFAITGTNYTVTKLDGTTTAFIVTLDDATSPTAATRA